MHGASLFKNVLFGFCLSSSRQQYFSVYFMVRFTIYASTFFFILSHLRVIRKFVLKKGELKTVFLRRNFLLIKTVSGNWEISIMYST